MHVTEIMIYDWSLVIIIVYFSHRSSRAVFFAVALLSCFIIIDRLRRFQPRLFSTSETFFQRHYEFIRRKPTDRFKLLSVAGSKKALFHLTAKKRST